MIGFKYGPALPNNDYLVTDLPENSIHDEYEFFNLVFKDFLFLDEFSWSLYQKI